MYSLAFKAYYLLMKIITVLVLHMTIQCFSLPFKVHRSVVNEESASVPSVQEESVRPGRDSVFVFRQRHRLGRQDSADQLLESDDARGHVFHGKGESVHEGGPVCVPAGRGGRQLHHHFRPP